jgi:SAM-dependent methyltransferase
MTDLSRPVSVGVMEANADRIELLSTRLLTEERPAVEAFRDLSARLGIEIGWHYLLDLAWVARHLGDPAGRRVLDAGAGTGVLQWWLAERGASVTSVDRYDRSDLSLRFRMRYRVTGDLLGLRPLWARRVADAGRRWPERLASAARLATAAAVGQWTKKAPGSVRLLQRDLRRLDDLPAGSFDAVVSISALEHNEPQDLSPVVASLIRLLRPGGVLLATLGASASEDWYHEPSRGWCYSRRSLSRAFLIPVGADPYPDYDSVLNELRESTELRTGLSNLYFRSGENGMPWGIWDPRYVPVGVACTKVSPTQGSKAP